MKSLRFAVLISGMPSRADEKLCEQYEKNNTTMNLAALADDDVVVDERRRREGGGTRGGDTIGVKAP